VFIATLTDDPHFIVGYSVLEGTHLHWVYVKSEYRETGIGTLLTKGFQTISNPITKIGKAIATRHGLKPREEKEKANG
jgi:hypothetical protein